MQSKRILALFLISAMLVTMITGCTGDSTAQPAASPGSTAASTTSAPANAGNTAPAGDIRTIRLLGGTTGQYDPVRWDDREQYSSWRLFLEIVADYGIKLEIEPVPSDQLTTTVQTRMATASNLPDVIAVKDIAIESLVKFIQQGLVIPLNPLFEEYSARGNSTRFFTEIAPFARALFSYEDGNTYYFGSTVQRVTGISNGLRFNVYAHEIRQDWLEELGLGFPQNLSEYVSALKAFQEQDVNGNGVKDEVVVVDISKTGTGIAQWFGVGSEMFFVDMTDNKVGTPWHQKQEMLLYIEFMQELYKDGLLDAGSFDQQTKLPSAAKLAENVVSALTQPNRNVSANLIPVSNLDRQVWYHPVGPDMGVEGVEPLVSYSSGSSASPDFAFTKACTDLVAAGRFLDMICGPEYSLLANKGEEGQHWYWNEKNFLVDIYDDQNRNSASNKDVMFEKKSAPLWAMPGTYMLPRMNMEEYFGPDMILISDSITDERYEIWTTEINPSVDKRGHVYGRAVANWPKWMLHDTNTKELMALPTDAQFQTISQYSIDLTTYAEETLSKLIIGQLSLDDWDSYVSNMEKMGLSVLLETYQEMHDTYRAGL